MLIHQYNSCEVEVISRILSYLKRPGQAGDTDKSYALEDKEPPIPAVAQPADWLNRGVTEYNDDIFTYNPLELPLPNQLLRAAVSGPDLDRFMYIGSAWSAVCVRYQPTKSEPTVLDIGCGVGKMARFLAINPELRYVGFDIYLPAIRWCQREFSRVYGDRFRFEHFDGHSSMYNPGGTVQVQDYRFPVDDDSIDLAIGASIFTHLYEEDMRHYFVETARVLRDGGVAVFSIHTLDEAGAFFSDSQGAGDRKILGNEQVMLIDKAYFISIGEEHGLRLLDSPGRLCGQELIVFQKSSPNMLVD